MSIDIFNDAEVRKLAKAVEFSWTDQSAERERRNSLIRIYSDMPRDWYSDYFADRANADAQYLAHFQQYVRGHVMNLGYTAPKWLVSAKQLQGKGFDKRIQLMLNYYFSILDGWKLIRKWSYDTAFGDAVAKIVYDEPPLGITAPIAPRVYRLDPNRVLRDRSADTVEDCYFVGDLYYRPYKEAVADPSFDPIVAAGLSPYKIESDDSRSTFSNRTSDAYPVEVVRLLDLYLPSTGQLLTFDAPHDSFHSISAGTILKVQETTINPYEFCRLIVIPDSVAELGRLYFLRQLNFLANDMIAKAALQARSSKRNPIDKQGNENELNNILQAPDNEAVFLADIESPPTVFNLPGPEPSIVEMSTIASQMFSQQAGNLETAMGINPGSKTARQTQAMLGQITSVTDFDRSIFETFLSRVGQKLATLAMQSETLEFSATMKIPGTQYLIPFGWAPPEQLPREGEITDFNFEVAPYSTAYRSPQERLAQLQAASTGILQWLSQAAAGAPINLAAVMESYAEAFDMVVQLPDWWSGEKPSPAEQTVRTYQAAMQHQPGGSNVNYQSNSQLAGPAEAGLSEPAPGGTLQPLS